MRLTRRGRIVVNTLLILFVVFALAVAGRFDAMDQCAKDAGCSFDPLPNGEYPYTWTP
jgi:hypothetical protein